jgi:hypothetical protein
VDLALGRWVFPRNEAKGKKTPRVVYLTQETKAITLPPARLSNLAFP